MKSRIFNGLLMAIAVAAAYLPIRSLPGRRPLPPATFPLEFHQVELAAIDGPLRLAGAWELETDDRRFGGISALAIDGGRFLAITDRGAVLHIDPPTAARPRVDLADLRDGPGLFDKQRARDAESLAPDPGGRGWWVGYEQNHSLWLYDPVFQRALASIDLNRRDWRDNRGAEGLVADGAGLLVLGENGRGAMRVGPNQLDRVSLGAGAEVADAARAPDGSAWLLLRSKGLDGIRQSIAPLVRTKQGYRAGPGWRVPKAAFDNYEGMTIAPLAGGGWRFWLVTDDGHRIMARTLLVALDLAAAPRHGKSPAQRTGLSRKPSVETP